jgi:DNA polymerase I-like protein with 3'-5' exonuclease and polymerase domains
VHGLIKPPEGWGVACLDWSAQEIGILAGLSEDPAMIADYASGDFHLRFAIRGGLAPEDATKATHGTLRDTIKPISLGVGYGRQAKSIARGAGKSASGRRRCWRGTATPMGGFTPGVRTS